MSWKWWGWFVESGGLFWCGRGLRLRRGERAARQRLRGWFVESCGLFCCGQGNDCFGEGGGVEGRERAGKSGRGNDYGRGKTGWKNEKEREGKKQKVKFSFQPFYSSKTTKTNRVNWITDLTVGTSDLRLAGSKG